MYKRQQKGWLKHIDFILWDLLCLAVSYPLAYALRHGSAAGLFANQVYVNTGIVLIFVDLMIAVLFNTMHNILRRGPLRELAEVIREDLIVFGVVAIYLFSVKDGDQVSRITLWTTMGLHILTSYAVFLIWKRVIIRRNARNQKRSLLLVADRDMVQGVLERFKSDPTCLYNVTGIVLADGNGAGGEISGIPVICAMDDAARYICREWIDEVYICTAKPPRELIAHCNEMGVTVHRELLTAGNDQQFVEKIAGQYALTSTMKSATPGQVFIKRAMDIAGGLVGSFIAVVIIAIVGPKIKKASPGPILFKQERIGQNGKRFKMFNVFEEVFQSALCNKPTNIAV